MLGLRVQIVWFLSGLQLFIEFMGFMGLMPFT